MRQNEEVKLNRYSQKDHSQHNAKNIHGTLEISSQEDPDNGNDNTSDIHHIYTNKTELLYVLQGIMFFESGLLELIKISYLTRFSLEPGPLH